MVRKTKTLSMLGGRRIRVTRLDGCGRVVYGDAAVGVSKGFVSAGFTANTTETDEIRVVNASGETCIYEASRTSLVGYGLEIVFCNVDPDILALITGQDVVMSHDGQTVIGFDVDTAISLTDQGFAFEMWMGAPAGDACATDASQGSFGYLLLPYVTGGILGDFSVENGAVNFTITGAQTKNGAAWGTGPYNVMTDAQGLPAKMPSPVKATTALRLIEVDLLPPAPLDGARPLLDPEATELASLTATVAAAPSREVDFGVVPDPAEGEGVYYDFGDGTWDYVITVDGGTTHTYSQVGTYTVKATANGKEVTTNVTVPTP